MGYAIYITASVVMTIVSIAMGFPIEVTVLFGVCAIASVIFYFIPKRGETSG